VLVLTDGANSIRRATSPGAAAEQAAAAGVPVYTILLGDDPGRPDQPLPAETLSSMATRTGGIFAQSTTSADLQAVFADIGSIVTPTPVRRELTVWAAGLALALLALAALVAGLSRPRRREAPPRAAAAG
jgi:Ca-activated chloride channel family protein